MCGAFLFLECEMRHQYRVLVEAILEQEKKLSVADELLRVAESDLKSAQSRRDHAEARLKENKARLSEIEKKMFGSEA